MTQQPYISDLKLEELALGTLAKSETKALLEALEHDQEAKGRLEAIEQSNEDLLRELSPDEVDAEVARRIAVLESKTNKPHPEIKKRHVIGPRLAWSALAVSICTAALLVVFLPREENTPGYRTKGEPRLLVHRVVKDGIEQLAEGASVCEGDRIQLSVVPAGRKYFTVFSVDGRGHLTLHFPQEGEDGKIEESDTPFPLPRSYELDDAPAFERFFLIASQTPLEMATIMKIVRKQLKNIEHAVLDDLPVDTTQSSFLLEKARQER